MEHAPVRQRRRPTIGHLVLTAFAVSLAILVVVTAMTTRSSFDRERRRSELELRVAAQREIDRRDDLSHVQAFFEQMTRETAVVALDPAGCQALFDGLRGLVDVNVHLLRADGSEVCSLTDARAPGARIEPGAWLAQTLAEDGLVTQTPAISPSADTPATLTSMRVPGPDGPVGALVSQIYTGYPAIEAPMDLAPDTSIFVVDPARSLILATTANRSGLLGTRIDGRPRLPGETIAVEVTSSRTGWHAQAVLPKAVALAAARAELRRTLLVGATSVLVVLLLGLLLHRRVARPMRGLRQALLASLRGDTSARAPVTGPAEVAEAGAIFNDLITERNAREAELAWKASHDNLTGLANRDGMLQELDELLAAGRDDLAVFFLDLDRFKLVNDSHGHAVGDDVLVGVGHRLCDALGAAGVVAHFGGDEFVAVCPEVGGHRGALRMGRRLIAALRLPLRLDGREIWLNGSVGIAIARPGDEGEDLVRNADTAMYRAKAPGGGGQAVFDHEMRDSAVRRLDLERDLNRAVERQDLLVHYQPKFALGNREMVGAEALVRWPHVERGLVPPSEFIPVAEETGLIVAMDRWVLKQAMSQAGRWRRENEGLAFPVAVNLSSVHLADPGLPGIVADAVGSADALPTDLILEITESAVLQDLDGAIERLDALRRMGIRISIDDFGTGYSSLAYLQRLPIDELKIDLTFVQRLQTSPTAEIVGSIIDMAHALGLTVVAEGIETEDQLRILRDLGCDVGQGFLLARPRPSDVVSGLLCPSSLVGHRS